jgi:hypothetical protein
MDNINNMKEEEFKSIEEQYNKLKEKSLLYKLKRWEKILMQKLGNIISRFKLFKDYKDEIKKQNDELNENIKKEMEILEVDKKMIELEKEESINKLENEKQSAIKANDEKYGEILSYLNSIKNDRDKLIEFLQNKNYF